MFLALLKAHACSVCASRFVGLASYGGYYLYRLVKVYAFDTEHPLVESRRRYLEKQQIFMQQLDESLAAGHMAAMVKEYNPAATRLPFQRL